MVKKLKLKEDRTHLYSSYKCLKKNADIIEIRKTNPSTIRELFGISKNKLLKQYYQNKSINN